MLREFSIRDRRIMPGRKHRKRSCANSTRSMSNERIDMFPPALWMRVAEQVERIQNLSFIAGRQHREQRSHCRFVKVPKLQGFRLDRLLLERLPERLHVPM